jgi:Ca2+-binding RTX toxin-like protein
MKRNGWLGLLKLKKQHTQSRRRSACAAPRLCVTEMLEVRVLLTHGALDVDPNAETPEDADVPANVTLTQEPGYFELAVGVPELIVDLAIFNHPGRFPSEDGDPVLIDGGGLAPVDESSDTEPLSDVQDEIALVDGGIFDQDILVSVGVFGFPLVEMFGGQLPDNDALNEFLANGPAEDGFLSQLIDQGDGHGLDIGLEMFERYFDGPLTHVVLHDDGIEVFASLPQLFLEGPDQEFSDPFDFGFEEESEFDGEEPVFNDGGEDEDDDGFFEDLLVTVEYTGDTTPCLPSQSCMSLPPELLDELDLEVEDEPFSSSVPISGLLFQAIAGAALFTLDTNPDFEFGDGDDFEPDPETFRFSLGVHLVGYGTEDATGVLPNLGIPGDYDYSVTLLDLAGIDLDTLTGAGGTAEPPVDEESQDNSEETTASDTETVSAANTDETIRVRLEAIFGEDGPRPQAAPMIEFGTDEVQLADDGTLTINLPETPEGGWTVTATGTDLAFDFESNAGDASDTVSLVGATTLIINGTQADDYIDLDLTDLDAPDLDAIALHGHDGDDGLDLIGGERDRFSELLLTGGQGDDFIAVGLTHADVILRGGHGDDILFGGKGHDELHGGAGEDLLDGGRGNDQLYGGVGDDVILGGGGHDSMWGAAGDDRLVGHSGRDRAFGGSGNDSIDVGRGRDRATGGGGDDSIDGGSGRDTLRGGGGRDQLFGRSGNDRMFGGRGNDTLDGSAGRDIMRGGDGNDELRGGRGDDQMFGERGRDRLFGSRGRDRLSGGDDDDSMFGNDGDDTMVGSRGDDIWMGGSGGNIEILFIDPPPRMPPVFPGPPPTLLEDDEPSTEGNSDDVDEEFVNFDEMVEVL